MYAVIKAGGKQHRVKPGDVIEVELMHGQHGTSITFTPLLVVDDEGKTHFGRDLGRAQVKAKLLGEEKGEKVKIFKYRAKTGYAKRMGHRQLHSLVEIEDVVFGRRAGSKKEEESTEDEAAPAEEAAPPKPEEAPPAAKASRAKSAVKSPSRSRSSKGRA